MSERGCRGPWTLWCKGRGRTVLRGRSSSSKTTTSTTRSSSRPSVSPAPSPSYSVLSELTRWGRWHSAQRRMPSMVRTDAPKRKSLSSEFLPFPQSHPSPPFREADEPKTALRRKLLGRVLQIHRPRPHWLPKSHTRYFPSALSHPNPLTPSPFSSRPTPPILLPSPPNPLLLLRPRPHEQLRREPLHRLHAAPAPALHQRRRPHSQLTGRHRSLPAGGEQGRHGELESGAVPASGGLDTRGRGRVGGDDLVAWGGGHGAWV